MKKIFAYILMSASLLGFTSCIEDDNNYNYTEEIRLTSYGITGLHDEYSFAYGQERELAPTYEFTSPVKEEDLAFEWRLDGELLLEETGPTCRFSFDKMGQHEVTFSVVYKPRGVKFSKTVKILVRSPFARGWLVLSENNANESELNFVGANSFNYTTSYTYDKKTYEVLRDTLRYDIVMKDVSPNLGQHPKGILLNTGYIGRFGELFDNVNEVIVMQDRWAELNGNSLEREVFTEDEFQGDLPATGFQPLGASMSYSAKALLNKDGYIYWNRLTYASDFHSGAYANFPLGKDKKFKAVYPLYRINEFHAAIPALTDENELVGIIDDALTFPNSAELRHTNYNSGVYSIQNGGISSSPKDDRYKFGSSEVITLEPASPEDDGPQEQRPGYVGILKTGGNYELIHFIWENGRHAAHSRVRTVLFDRMPLHGLTGFTDIAIFNNKKYAIIADGNVLYYIQYGVGNQSKLIKLHTFNSAVKALGANDINVFYFKRPNKWQPPHYGHLGVALEDGTFYIFEVVEKQLQTNEDQLALTKEVSVNQLFPDLNSSVQQDNHFDKIVDVRYKYSKGEEFLRFSY